VRKARSSFGKKGTWLAVSLTLSAAVATAIPLAARPIDNRTVVNMRTEGAVCDGTVDDSAAIQAAIDRAPNNTRFYFPAGTCRFAGIVISHRSRLEFDGDGASSIMRWSGAGLPGGYNHPMMTFTSVSDLLIRDLAFDNRSINTYGGVVFFSTKRVEIRDTTFTDSNPQAPIGIDRYSYVFGRGDVPHEDVRIHRNAITNLQLEVDHVRRLEVRENTVTRGTQTAGIGLFSVDNRSVLEDVLIDSNTIIDPETSGIALLLDPPSNSDVSFQRIRVTNNSILFRTAGEVGISVGTSYVPARPTGNIFRDITIEGNYVLALPAAGPTGELLRVLSGGSFTFDRLVVRGNVLVGNGQLTSDADATAQVRYALKSEIVNNTLRGAVNGLIAVAPQASRWIGNDVQLATGTTAFFFNFSRGKNVFRNNTGGSIVYQEGPHPTDKVE
jgi:Pectate lyase superfamily protein